MGLNRVSRAWLFGRVGRCVGITGPVKKPLNNKAFMKLCGVMGKPSANKTENPGRV